MDDPTAEWVWAPQRHRKGRGFRWASSVAIVAASPSSTDDTDYTELIIQVKLDKSLCLSVESVNENTGQRSCPVSLGYSVPCCSSVLPAPCDNKKRCSSRYSAGKFPFRSVPGLHRTETSRLPLFPGGIETCLNGAGCSGHTPGARTAIPSAIHVQCSAREPETESEIGKRWCHAMGTRRRPWESDRCCQASLASMPRQNFSGTACGGNRRRMSARLYEMGPVGWKCYGNPFALTIRCPCGSGSSLHLFLGRSDFVPIPGWTR